MEAVAKASPARLALKKFLGVEVMVEVRAPMLLAIAPPRIERSVVVDLLLVLIFGDAGDDGENPCGCW